MIFGYRNHNTTNSSFRLIGTTHTDCGNAPNNNNNNNVSGINNNTTTTLTGGLSIAGVINNSNSSNSNNTTVLGGIGNNISSSSTTTSLLNSSRPSNYYTSRSVSWNTIGSYLAVAGSALTVRLLNVEYGTSTSITNSDSILSIPGSNNSNITTNTNDSSNLQNQNQNQQQHQLITGKEVVAITTGIGGNNVTKVRFHPNDNNIVCSADSIVQIWDIRSTTSQRSIGKINIHSNGTAIAIDWNPTNTNNNILQVTERDNSIYIYDIRKLSSTSTAGSSGKNKDTSSSNNNTNNSLCYFKMKQSIYVDTCLFTPDGTSIIAGTTSRENGIGQLRVFPWMYNNSNTNDRKLVQQQQQQPMTLPTLSTTNDNNSNSIVSATYTPNYPSDGTIPTTGTTTLQSNNKTNNVQCNVYSGHAGPIYAMSYSNNKQYLATGGSDASVAIWDVTSMCCIQSITRRTKFIRSVAFSSNNTILATSSEEDTIDLAHVPTGQLIGLASFSTTGSTSTSGGGISSTLIPSLTSNTSSSNRRIGNEGAEEITFHPSKDMYILACARTSMGPISTPPVAIIKLHISQ